MVLVGAVVEMVAVVEGSFVVGTGVVGTEVIVVVMADSFSDGDAAATERSEFDPPPSEHALSRQATATPLSSRPTGLKSRTPTIAGSVGSAPKRSSESMHD